MRLKGSTWLKALLAVIVCGSLLGADLFSGSLVDLDKEITSLLNGVHPSVVTIHTYRKLDPPADGSIFPFRAELVDTQIGTGVVYSDNGHVITTRNVVRGGSRFEVVSRDGRRFEAVLVGVDPDIDLSVLQIAVGQLPTLPINSSKPVTAGSLLFVVGNSFGIPNAANLATAIGYRGDGHLQVSTNLAPGFSGGPVVNVEGEMVGLVSAKLTEPTYLSSLTLHRQSSAGLKAWSFSGAEVELPSTGVVLAITAADVAAAADRIVSGEHRSRGFLGVQPEDVDTEWLVKAFNIEHGVMITDVLPSSPAWKAGIRSGDILTQYLGRRIRSSDQLRKLIAANRPGDIVSLVILRASRQRSLTVQLTSQQTVMVADMQNPGPNLRDTIRQGPDAEFPIDDNYRERMESRILELRRDVLRQMDLINALQRELERLKKEGR